MDRMADRDLTQALAFECQQKLDVVRRMQQAELEKPLAERSAPLLRFLDKEAAVHAFALSLLARLEGDSEGAGAPRVEDGPCW